MKSINADSRDEVFINPVLDPIEEEIKFDFHGSYFTHYATDLVRLLELSFFQKVEGGKIQNFILL